MPWPSIWKILNPVIDRLVCTRLKENLHSPQAPCGCDWVATSCVVEAIKRAPDDFRFWRAPCKGGAFQWVQAPPGNRSSRKQPEQSWR